MTKGGSEVEKAKLKFYRKDFRGLHASCDIVQGEKVLFVPWIYVLDIEKTYNTPIG